MSENGADDGWDRLSEAQLEESLTTKVQFPKTKPLELLYQQYSLEPDMIFGWIPKLPSCPIPLSYKNQYVQEIIQKLKQKHIRKTKLEKQPLGSPYQIVYQGEKVINSVQMNRKFQYFWKYRTRYQIKVKALKDAIENVGKPQQYFQQQQIPLSRNAEYVFDSSFQSGNLGLAIRVTPNQYDLFIRNDTNTLGHTNWFYFKVNNQTKLGIIRLNICNIVKSKNLYSKGMKPYVKVGKIGEWTQTECLNVEFIKKNCRYGNTMVNVLQFQYNFTEQGQDVFFASSIPYTYSDLLTFVKDIKQKYSDVVTISSLSQQSLGGLDIPVLKMTSAQNSAKSVVLMTARIHPGESNSSHMIQGFIRALLEEKRQLLDWFIFYIVPMLNPDGVIAGNYRTSYSGRDLNRMFEELGNKLYPEINGLHELAKKIQTSKLKIEFYCDFHGHSSKKNLFCYGPEHLPSNLYYFNSRIFAKLIQKETDLFDYSRSLFFVSEHKKNTARAYMLRKRAVPMSFTFQISNGLYNNSENKSIELNQKLIQLAGKSIAFGFNLYYKYLCKNHKINIFPHRSQTIIGGKRSSCTRKKYLQRKSLITLEKCSNELICQLDTSSLIQRQIQFNNLISLLSSEIAKEKCKGKELQEKGSDSESSDEDLTDGQIRNLFSDAKYLKLPTQVQKPQLFESFKLCKSVKPRESVRRSLPFNTAQKEQQLILKSKQNFSKSQFIVFGQAEKGKKPNKFKSYKNLSSSNHKKIKREEVFEELFHFSSVKSGNIGNFSKIDKKPIQQKRFPMHF